MRSVEACCSAMKRSASKRSIVCFIALAGCTSSAPPHWHVDGDALRDPDGRAVILRGMNVSGTQKSAPYLDGKTAADYARIRTDWGMNGIRFVMTWSAVEPQEGQYDDAYLDMVAERMQWAADAGLTVVLDMHEDVYGEGFGFDGAPRWTCDEARYAAFTPTQPWFLGNFDPNVEACVDGFYETHTKAFAAAWAHVAKRLAASPAVIGFDVLNEPGWGTYAESKFEHDRLAPMYREVVAAVRAEAPEWVAFLEPSSSRNAGFPTGLTAFDFPDVMYAPHSYDSNAEMGSGFDPTHRDQVIANVADLAGEAKMLHAGMWIGEYGGVAMSAGIADYMTAEYDAAGMVAASTMYWADDDGGYGPVNTDGSERQPLVDTLVRPYPERVAGDPTSYAFDAATSTFTFVYRPRAMKQPTRIVVPARVYPQGFTVDCGDCATSRDGDVVVIDRAPSSGTITLHP
ncbi:MAG TPA: cellulase family glycosylhydrolase [Kofleriaceae bacterium]|nr:cellulase family glycosylhydrolase [Kofleriaceae bacterium]